MILEIYLVVARSEGRHLVAENLLTRLLVSNFSTALAVDLGERGGLFSLMCCLFKVVNL